MYAAEGFVLRASIVMGMVAAVVTILYFSPMPDYLYKSCDRPCNEIDWPMICRVKLVLESKTIPYRDCSNGNQSDCDKITEGIISAYMTRNNIWTGPTIQVCQNDVLIIDVYNKLPGQGITIHWRGQKQKETPFMDGAPMITQCPINSYTNFQYKFRASQVGTHLWHAHGGSEQAQGFFGALIVRSVSNKLDVNRKLYDYDDKKHVMLISEWSGGVKLSNSSNTSNSILINGKFDEYPSIFEVKRGYRYRFRIIFGGATTSNCPIELNIENHTLSVISLDGHSTHPHRTDSVILTKGERVDVVVKSNREAASTYNINVFLNCNGKTLKGGALLKYSDSEGNKLVRNKLIKENVSISRKFSTSLCESKDEQVCLPDLHSARQIPKILKADEVDRAIFLPFGNKIVAGTTGTESSRVYHFNNISFIYPSSPLLTQYNYISYESICNALTLPVKCKNHDLCECVHVENISLGSSVELLLIDEAGESPENNFHLHGYNFFVVGSKVFEKAIKINEIKAMDRNGTLFKRNLINPVQKDTIRVPRFGVVALRFFADNPGFWMLRDGYDNLWTRGLDLVFNVGSLNDYPAIPSSFPTCGSWSGPDFALM